MEGHRLSESIFAPGGGSQIALHAPPARNHVSRHESIGKSIEGGLVGSMQELRLQTVAKNKSFFERCDAIESRRENVESRLDREILERDEYLQAIRDSVQEETHKLQEALLPAIEQEYEKREAVDLVTIKSRMDAVQAAERSAYQEEVPALTQHISGEAVLRMQRERQSFDLDNTKALARERVLSARFERWLQSTRQRSNDEAADRTRLIADISETHGKALHGESRSLEALEVACTTEIAGVATRAVLVSRSRSRGDEVLASDLETVMHRLQAQVIDTFGGDGNSNDSDNDSADDDD